MRRGALYRSRPEERRLRGSACPLSSAQPDLESFSFLQHILKDLPIPKCIMIVFLDWTRGNIEGPDEEPRLQVFGKFFGDLYGQFRVMEASGKDAIFEADVEIATVEDADYPILPG